VKNPFQTVGRVRDAFAGVRGRSSAASSTATVFCFGQSNSVCLVQAWFRRLYRPSDDSLRFKFILTNKNRFPGHSMVVTSSVTGADAICDALAGAIDAYDVLSGSTEAWLLAVVRGNAYNAYGLFEPDPQFDFVDPHEPEAPVRPDTRLLPYDAIKAVFREYSEQTRRLYRCLPRTNVAGVIHLEAPPPIPSAQQCGRSIEGVLLKRKFGRPQDVRISSREFRMKLWRCQSEVNRQVCDDTNTIYVGPPEEALDSEGYLRPDAWSGATHASAWYGALALKKVERIITERRRAAMRDALPAEPLRAP